jgi:hypothetical protein
MTDSAMEITPVGRSELNSRTDSDNAFKLHIYNPLVWMAIALCPFQDTLLQYTPLKLVSASFSFVPLMCLFLLSGVRHWLHRPFIVSRTVLIVVIYAVAVCAANLVWIDHGEAVIHTQSLIASTLMTALTMFTIWGVHYEIGRWLRIWVYFAFFFTIVGVLSGEILGTNAISWLQVTPSLSGRPHGFSTEPGTLSVQVVAIGMLAAHFVPKNWQKWAIGAITCVLLVFSRSKGGLIALVLCAIVLGVAKRRASLRSKILVAIFLIPSIYFGALLIIASFGTIIESNETSTIATRFSMAVYALITVAHHPFGVGFTGFLPSLPRYLPQAMEFIEKLFPFPLAFVEVKEYLYPPQTDADCKTFFFDFLVFFGIPFAVVFFRFVGNLMSRLFKCGHSWLFVGVLFSVLALITYYSTIYAWILPLLFGISLREVRQTEAADNVRKEALARQATYAGAQRSILIDGSQSAS